MRSPRGVAIAGVVAMIVLATGACGRSRPPPVHVLNATDIPVAVFLDGALVGIHPPGAEAEVELTPGDPPFVVEVRSGSGASLGSLTVDASTLEAVEDGTAALGQSFVLPCGRVQLWIGDRDEEAARPPEQVPPVGPCP